MSLLTDAPKPGYHGNDGYRRNTPELRSKPSSFDCEGIGSSMPIKKFHYDKIIIR